MRSRSCTNTWAPIASNNTVAITAPAVAQPLRSRVGAASQNGKGCLAAQTAPSRRNGDVFRGRFIGFIKNRRRFNLGLQGGLECAHGAPYCSALGLTSRKGSRSSCARMGFRHLQRDVVKRALIRCWRIHHIGLCTGRWIG